MTGYGPGPQSTSALHIRECLGFRATKGLGHGSAFLKPITPAIGLDKEEEHHRK